MMEQPQLGDERTDVMTWVDGPSSETINTIICGCRLAAKSQQIDM